MGFHQIAGAGAEASFEKGLFRRLSGRTSISTIRRDFAADLLQVQRRWIADATSPRFA